ncbi:MULTISPECIES: M23 family metallopeptidase [unclassified Streptomyces]|uniref:M23 family metallopeptidase n=1 Tax=unclassified Streptomyces TaxID=2593676 RepID=UPI001905E204|nr:M23 family metallopeptidase [Streptomyces sp. HSG2]
MPVRGKHRRTKSTRLTRAIVVAGTGGAALALPFVGAVTAHAAPAQSPATGQVAHSGASDRAESTSRDNRRASEEGDRSSHERVYTVRSGDWLAKIAHEQDVRGGWQRLWADNREAVGENPSLIHPGLKLTLDGASSSDAAQAPAPEATESAAPTTAEPSQEAEESTDQAAEQPAAEPAAEETPAQTAGVADSAAFVSPVPGGTVGTAYGQAGSLWSSGYHTGADFSVPTGTSLKAVGSGTVVSAGSAGAYGNQVVIKLDEGHYAQYAHLSSISVSVGQSVTAGQEIGLSGSTGNSTGPHLHFEIRTTPDYGSDVDPIAFLRSQGVSL